MTEAERILAAAKSVLVVDWPSREVPETLARAGLEVVVHGGPGPEDYTEYSLEGGEVVVRQRGRPPEQADLVYTHRPFSELPGIVETAQALGASAIWAQSGVAPDGSKDPTGCWLDPERSREAREVVARAGLAYEDESYVVDVARRLDWR